MGTVVPDIRESWKNSFRKKTKADTREGELEARKGLKVQGHLALLKQQAHYDL